MSICKLPKSHDTLDLCYKIYNDKKIGKPWEEEKEGKQYSNITLRRRQFDVKIFKHQYLSSKLLKLKKNIYIKNIDLKTQKQFIIKIKFQLRKIHIKQIL